MNAVPHCSIFANTVITFFKVLDFDIFLQACTEQKDLFEQYFKLILELQYAKLENKTLTDLRSHAQTVQEFVG